MPRQRATGERDRHSARQTPMSPVVSVAWDRFAVAASVLFTVCVVVCIPGLFLAGWRGFVYSIGLPGFWHIVPTIPAIFLFAFVPAAFSYWQITHWRLMFTDLGIAGISRDEVIKYSTIDKWTIKETTLMLWPKPGTASATESGSKGRPILYSQRGAVVRYWIRPGVPRGTYWATIQADKALEISDLLTHRIGRPT